MAVSLFIRKIKFTVMTTRNYERNLILSDALICSVLSAEAKKSGISLEEYVDKFLDVFYNEPHKLPILNW